MPGEPVFVSRRLPAAVMERLAAECGVASWPGETPIPRAVLLDEVRGRKALITLLTERVDAELLEIAGSSLEIVANYAVGVDNVDIDACTSRSIMVTNTPDVLTEATADMAWALMLAAARRLAEGDRLVRSGRPWMWGPELMLGQDVSGRTLGIVGFGRIGRAVAKRAAGFGMRVVIARRPGAMDGPQPEPKAPEAMPLEALLEVADFVSLHVNLTKENRHLISAARLALMKPTAVLVNTSRGPVVDEEALAEALDRGTIFAAGLDVFEREPEVSYRLLEHPRVVLCPHLGSATVHTRVAMGMVAVDNVLAALRGQRPPTLVNETAWRARAGVDG